MSAESHFQRLPRQFVNKQHLLTLFTGLYEYFDTDSQKHFLIEEIINGMIKIREMKPERLI